MPLPAATTMGHLAASESRLSPSLAPEFSEIPGGILLDAIVRHLQALVLVCEPSGLRVLACNSAATDAINQAGLDPVTVALPELFHPALAQERIPLIRDAIARGEPLRMVGMVAGVWKQCNYYPFETTDGEARLLVASMPVTDYEEDPTETPEAGARRAQVDDLGALADLTEREIEVLRLIGLGLSADQVAHTLHRSIKTVQNHRSALGAKLNIENRVELARIALRSGITRLSNDETVRIWRQAHQHHHR